MRRIKYIRGQLVTTAVVFLILLAPVAYAQQRKLTGVVSDSANKPLPSATVNLVNDKATIIKYDFTDENGAFTFNLTAGEAALPLWLEASYVGHRNQRIALSPGQNVYHFKLVRDPGILNEVIVRTKPPVEQTGDTLHYNVSKFARKEDRSIGDVLKRMPGIEVGDDGSVYFNGKKISNLYIHGDDLMTGRYGAATKVIRKEMIESVDIIMNHQPVKVLKNKIPTDNTALNLVLKDENSLKLSVNGMIGAGLPRLYDASATAVLLNSRIKALNNIGLNNSGVNYTDDFKQLGASNFISEINNTPPKMALSMATIGPPDLPLPNYYFNNSKIINLNNLYKTKNDIQFKINMQAFTDRNNLEYLSRTDNYLLNDTISFRERQYLTNKPSLLNASFNIMINKEPYFLNNNMKVELSHEDNGSFMQFNDNTFNQGVNRKIKNFSNDINYIPSLPGRGIGELRWLVSYNENRQFLDIGSGYNFEIGNQQDYYDDVIQNLRIPALFSHLYLGYRLPGTILTQKYTAGYIIESQDLVSQLELIRNGGTTPYSGDAGNNLQWHRNNIYFTPEYQVKYKSIRSTILLPVTYQNIHYSQQEYGLDSKNNNLLFNPSADFRYDLNPEQYLGASYTFNNSFSDISGIYRGGILENYRTFNAKDADLQQKATHSLAANYNFQKAINMLFINSAISFDKTIAETILSTEFLNNIQKTVFLPYRNTQSRLSLKAGFSKYLFKLKTTLSLKSQWSRFRYVQILNNTTQPCYNDALLFSAKLMKKISPAITIIYEPRGSWNTSHASGTDSKAGSLVHHAFRLDQYLSLGAAPLKKTNIEVTARHSFSNKSNSTGVQYFFMDAKATYTAKRMDLIFSVTNLFNVTNYTLYSLTPYQLMIDQYHIRGRMGILRLSYYF
ncbi:hypothetical protein A3860_21480 [Niastella vici]|uniref:TonB-dependent receptor-like beta-barrel domain-containing protein n=1 Tax=Niastella vici TaxID=1703345 RepID=A0A1V9G047_9BACT|nr:carboxypeptidase-like regulatory domain-containing protein [Niastella vici]OQP63995.1 hypothetical protein A3860_21480 [Niastella vici]